jgi:transcriptional regulator with XRE-family HTH domain
MTSMLGTNMIRLRTYMGRSQEQMALSLGLKRSTLSGYERGTAEPSIRTLIAVQEKFRVGLDVLLTVDLAAESDAVINLIRAQYPPRVSITNLKLPTT